MVAVNLGVVEKYNSNPVVNGKVYWLRFGKMMLSLASSRSLTQFVGLVLAKGARHEVPPSAEYHRWKLCVHRAE